LKIRCLPRIFIENSNQGTEKTLNISNRSFILAKIVAIYNPGDVAAATTDGVHSALLSCQHAMPQGRFAGNNAVAELFAKDLLMYEQPKYVTSLDLGSWGALYAEGWEQRVVSTKKAAKDIKLFINHERIYPPFADKDMDYFLEAAEPAFKAIKITK
jgi:NADH dehydrogenase